MNNNLAPIVVFAYNRPDHLRQTLEALAKNDLATQSVLYVYCDGAKPNATQEQSAKVSATQSFALQYVETAKQQKLFKEVHIVCAEQNKGLANSIIGGVTDVINQYGRVIVLEDDLLTSPYFLKYMNEALDFYESRPGVMSISADRPPVCKMEIPSDYSYDVFVSLRPFSYGWASWKDKWNRVDWSMDYLSDFLSLPEQVEAFNRGGDDMTEMLCMQRDGKIDSWAIRFSFAHFKEHCVAILPCIPYVDNIGFDGSGIHCGTNERDFRNNLSQAVENPRFTNLIYEDKRIINAFANYYSRTRRPLWKKVINWFARQLGKKPIYIIKKQIYA